jgi:arylsulfatase A-like enzyme
MMVSKKKRIHKWLVTGLVSFLGVSGSFSVQRPNILLLLTDDMGYGDLGCYGGTMVPTPNIDRLAKEGTRFTQFYVVSPVCSPSRAGILTGMYPARWRITNYLQSRAGNQASEQADFLDPAAPSLARSLKQAGYHTGHFGKWHVGGGRDVTNAPPFRAYGFDEHAGTWESPEPYPNITATNWIWSPLDKVKRWDRTAYFVDKTLDFFRRNQGEPCFVNLWPDDVHTPWVPQGSPLKGKSVSDDSQAKFQDVLREYDRQVGRLMAGLAELGVEKNTLVIFSSDNGPLPAFGGLRTGGLRGSKISLYEGGTRMPFILHWPGHVPANQVDEQSVLCAVDLFPSLCSLAKANLLKSIKFDGEDLSRVFAGKRVRRSQPILWEYGRNGAFNYPKGRDRSPNLAIREKDWKLLINADGSGAELYDLAKDRNETQNVAESNPAIKQHLADEVLKWRKALP